MDSKERIARRAAQELENGMLVNMGIGIATMVPEYISEDVSVIFQSDNGIMGIGPVPDESNIDRDIIDAGGKHVTITPSACFLDSAMSFAIIRGGHVDVTILGAFQVDETGTLASHIIPGELMPGMGGAMDLITGSKKVIITTLHQSKDGSPKILKKITLPATAINAVDVVVTEKAVMDITDRGIVVREIAEGLSWDELQSITEARLIKSDNLKTF